MEDDEEALRLVLSSSSEEDNSCDGDDSIQSSDDKDTNNCVEVVETVAVSDYHPFITADVTKDASSVPLKKCKVIMRAMSLSQMVEREVGVRSVRTGPGGDACHPEEGREQQPGVVLRTAGLTERLRVIVAGLSGRVGVGKTGLARRKDVRRKGTLGKVNRPSLRNNTRDLTRENGGKFSTRGNYRNHENDKKCQVESDSTEAGLVTDLSGPLLGDKTGLAGSGGRAGESETLVDVGFESGDGGVVDGKSQVKDRVWVDLQESDSKDNVDQKDGTGPVEVEEKRCYVKLERWRV